MNRVEFHYNGADINERAKAKHFVAFAKNITLLVCIAVPVYVLSAAFSIYSFGNENEVANADAAVVLGASAWNDRPSPVFRERINHGIWLYRNGYVKYLIFTGGKGRNAAFSESFVAKDYAQKNGVAGGRIFIEEESLTTFENILYARDIIRRNGFGSVIIVSDPMHMKRAVTIAKDLGLKVYSWPTPTTMYVSLDSKKEFLFHELPFYVAYNFYKYAPVIFAYIILLVLLDFAYISTGGTGAWHFSKLIPGKPFARRHWQGGTSLPIMY